MPPPSNIEWNKWAKDDPLYGIATCSGRDRGGAHPWTLPEFYANGEISWLEYFVQWQQYGVNSDSCLEIGCGAGRMSRALTQCFNTVYGIDISPDMLALAKANVAGPIFLLGDGTTIPLSDNSVTSVFSCQVFQHFNKRDMAVNYFREIYRVLRHGGTCMIQLPIAILPLPRITPTLRIVQRTLWRTAEAWIGLKASVKRWLISHANRRPFYLMIEFEPDWLESNLSEMGFGDIEIRLFRVTGNPGEKHLDSHLFARKCSIPRHAGI